MHEAGKFPTPPTHSTSYPHLHLIQTPPKSHHHLIQNQKALDMSNLIISLLYRPYSQKLRQKNLYNRLHSSQTQTTPPPNSLAYSNLRFPAVFILIQITGYKFQFPPDERQGEQIDQRRKDMDENFSLSTRHEDTTRSTCLKHSTCQTQQEQPQREISPGLPKLKTQTHCFLYSDPPIATQVIGTTRCRSSLI